MYAPTRTRAVHHPKDLWALCRCGGANGRAILGHMPGSCSYAQVHGFLPAQRTHSRRRMPHVCGMCNRGVRLQGFLSGRFVKDSRLFLILAKQVRSEDVREALPDETKID